jgi:saccharopine dehydrogenase-like NADP-dependent oxidoreductase
MKLLCLGGAGRICREAILDVVQSSDFDRITVADANEAAGREVVAWLDDPRVDFTVVDVLDEEATVALMRNYDLVVDGTPISMNDASAACMAKANVHGINLNGMSSEWDLDEVFKACGKTLVPGMGMTPGITNLMAKHAADQLDEVDSVRCSHGAFRPIAFSEAIAETTRVEYDPNLTSRVVFEDGQFVQVPPFARPRMIELPEPYGIHEQYIIPHPEPLTLSQSLADKGVRLVEARGTWPPKNMALLKALYEWGFLENASISLNGTRVGVLDAIFAYLRQSDPGTTTDLNGYALHVEVEGRRDGQPVSLVLTHTHPASDGSVADWTGLRAYTRCVGIPLGIGARLIATGQVQAIGVVPPELAFEPTDVFEMLAERQIFIHQKRTPTPAASLASK